MASLRHRDGTGRKGSRYEGKVGPAEVYEVYLNNLRNSSDHVRNKMFSSYNKGTATFLNPGNLFQVSVWERAPGKHLEKGACLMEILGGD